MQYKAWYKQPEMIVALSAIFISVLTAAIAVYSAYIERAYARASVWPRLEIFKSYSYSKDNYRYYLDVTNKGTGPAIIHYAKIHHQSKIIKQWSDIPGLTKLGQSHIGQRILAQGDKVKPLMIDGVEKTYIDHVLEVNAELQIELCYCSIYQECWLVTRENQPKLIDRCAINDEERFLQ